MVDNDGGQVVEAAPGVGEAGAGEVVEQVAGHVEAVERKLDEGVDFSPGIRGPSKPFNV